MCVCEWGVGREEGDREGGEKGRRGACMIVVKEEGELAYIFPSPYSHAPTYPHTPHTHTPQTHTHTHTHTHSPLSTSTDVSNLELGLDDVSDEGVMEGVMEEGPSNQHIGVPAAMKVINNEGGRKVSSKAEAVPKDAYFAFLLLRHLRIRDMRIKVSRAVAMVTLCTVQCSTILYHTLV